MRSGNAYYHREKNAITDEFDPRVHAAFPARRDRDYVVVGAVLCTKQLYCGSRVVFRMFLRINFLPQLAILQRLYPLHSGQF